MELAYLLACLAHLLDPGCPLAAPPTGIDWEVFCALVARHRLAGLLYGLIRQQPERWPAPVREAMRLDRYQMLIRGDRCERFVHAVLDAFQAAGIPVIVLKGWAAIPQLYEGDYGQRPFDDLDILVPPASGARAEEALRGLGYVVQLDEPWPGWFRRYHASRIYLLAPADRDPQLPFGVGLHWSLLDTPYYERGISTARLFSAARPLSVAGLEVGALPAENNLVYICGHLALHHSYDDALYRYYEIALLILRTGARLDWQKVIQCAEAWRLVLPVQRVLGQIALYWPTVVPAGVQASLAALKPGPAERVVHDCVVRYRANHTIRAFVAWLTMPGGMRRVRYLLETAWPTRAYMCQRYGPVPTALLPLLYFRRAALAARYVSR